MERLYNFMGALGDASIASLQFHGGVLGDASIDFVEMLCINSLRVAES